MGRPVVIRPILGAACALAMCIGLNAWNDARGPVAIGIRETQEVGGRHAVLIGSSHILKSIDALVLDTMPQTRNWSWFNVAQKGLGGAELLSVAQQWAEDLRPDILVLEIIGGQVNRKSVNWRLAGQLKCNAQIVDQIECQALRSNTLTRYQRVKNVLKHAMMRLTRGLHGLLRRGSESPPTLKGEIVPHHRGWPLQTATDTASWQSLRNAERCATTPTSDRDCGERPAFPMGMLEGLVQTCREHNIRLIPVLQPASGSHRLLDEVTEAIGSAPLMLGDGTWPSPFSRPEMMSDPMHLNAKGAEAVTLHLTEQLESRLH